ncbi:MAG: ribonuclease III domain-containing protein [Coleofasciculaceae cyanobacterium]
MSINIEAIKKVIGIPNFKQIDLLQVALTHPSYIYENRVLNRQQQDLQERKYRRLAILGDSILGAVVIDYLYDRFPDINQGALTDWKSDLVRRKKAYEFSRKFNLSHYCLLGRSQTGKDESEQKDLFAEMFEALLGAIYLEFKRDFSRTRDWLVNNFIGEAVDNLLTDTQISENQLPEDSLTAIGLMNTDESAKLLWKMKEKADALVSEDEKIQQILTWVNEKSLSIEPSYKPAKVRAFYLTLFRILGLAFARNFDPTRGASSARQFALSFNRANKIALDTAFINNSKFDPANVLISAFTLDFEPELRQALQQLQSELPEPEQDRERFENWRQVNGQTWVEKIRNILGHDLQLSKPQKKLLQEYYDANKLLVECLNNANDLTLEAREKIEATLFLPTELIR